MAGAPSAARELTDRDIESGTRVRVAETAVDTLSDVGSDASDVDIVFAIGQSGDDDSSSDFLPDDDDEGGGLAAVWAVAVRVAHGSFVLCSQGSSRGTMSCYSSVLCCAFIS